MDRTNSVLHNVTGGQSERHAEQRLAAALREMGQSRAVGRFLQKYGNVRTRAHYACDLHLYLRWLKSQGLYMPPDDLVKDNLVCVFRSDPVDVEMKRKHTDWPSGYISGYLIEKGASKSKRDVASSAVRGFYRTNDSALFGDYATAGPSKKG